MTNRRLSLGMAVSSANGDFTLAFEGFSVRVHRDGEFLFQLFESEVEPLFAAIYDGFSILSVGAEPKVRPALGGTQAYAIEEKEKGVILSPVAEDPAPSSAPIPVPSGHEDDPNICYIIRHEYKDLFFTENDMLTGLHYCSGARENAYPFVTNYAALRFTQAMTHPFQILSLPALHIVKWRLTDNDTLHYYDGIHDLGCLHKSKAVKMSLKQASRVAEMIPSNYIINVEKVQA